VHLRLSSSLHSLVSKLRVSMRLRKNLFPRNVVWFTLVLGTTRSSSAILIFVATCMVTSCCRVVPPCSLVLPTVCRRSWHHSRLRAWRFVSTVVYSHYSHASLLIGQDCCSSWAKILRLDRWLHLGFVVHFPKLVVFKAGVRRVRSWYRSSQYVSHFMILLVLNYPRNQNASKCNERSNRVYDVLEWHCYWIPVTL
jgi:hypothetical protein